MRVFNLLKNKIDEMEDKEDIDGLIDALNDNDENIRREALMALERIGDHRATEPIIQSLQYPDKTIQEEAITALGRIGDKKAVPSLIQTLNSQQLGIRWRSAEALGKIGDTQATEPLIQSLQDPDKTIQEEAITALGRIGDKKAVPSLIQTLNNQQLGIRWRSAEALGKIGDTQATEPLIQSLQDPDKTIQEEAITALGRIVVDPFIHDLKGEDRDLKDKAIIELNHIIELNVIEKNILSNEIKSSPPDNNQLDQDLKEEILNLKDDEQIISKLVPTEISDMDAKRAELTKKGYHIYIENFVKNSRYNYIDGFIRKSRYDYEFTDIRNLRELLQFKGLEFSDEEMLSLINEEIKNQKYLEFREKLMIQKPENLTDYLEILIKDYPEPIDHIDHLKKLLAEQNIPHNINLAEQIKKTQKQIEINEFENKILANGTINLVENASPSILMEFRMKELKENRDLMITNGKYIYIESFVKRSRSNYELGNVQRFRELLTDKNLEFSLDDLTWLIQEEIKNQEYFEFREKLMIQKPGNLTDYLEILINIYPKPMDHINHLKKLLTEQNIPHNINLAEQIKKTQKQIEIKKFENKILDKTVNEEILPVEMEDFDDAYVCFNIGNLYYDLGKIENALIYYDKALYIYPDFIDAWKHLGLIYYTMGRLQKAAACYNQILNFDPDNSELWLDIGIIFFEIGKVSEAKACYEKAMDMNPCYKNEDFAIDTRNFFKNNINSLKKFDSYLELASAASWESSDPTPPLSRIMRLLD